MMREIKFRAWDFNAKQMQQVAALYFELYRLREIETLEHKGAYIRNFANPQEIIAMQYTGLKDKNGKEIYEGDIVNLDGDIGVIEFDIGKFYIHWTEARWMTDEIHVLNQKIEVIGNIHENPELLEGKQ